MATIDDDRTVTGGAPAGADRVVLLMQGPMSPFFAHLRDRLVARGARVVKVQVCPADVVFWRRPGARWYRGRAEDFPGWLRTLIARERVTDLVAFGDRRALHMAAIDVALEAGVRVHAMELGYLRPDWLTVEPDGLASASRMPSDPAAIRALAAGREAPAANRLAGGSFLVESLYDILFNVSNVVLSPVLFPHYRRHATRHPFAEYAGWIGKFARSRWTAATREATLRRLVEDGAPMFLVPLQLSTDFQIRSHSPFPTLLAAVEWIVASFARNAPPGSRLLFKVHPLDNGLDRWSRVVPRIGRSHAVADRIDVVDGGDLDAMIRRCRGVVTVNSTVGLTAIEAGAPVIVLGNAVFDVPGLTHQGPLAGFWADPEPPDPALLADFRIALAHATQVRGGVITRRKIAIGAEAAAERILEPEQRLPTGGPGPRATPVFRRQAEWESEMAIR
jgi:capsular polysaccharide export protein